jgi:hypothetical protein
MDSYRKVCTADQASLNAIHQPEIPGDKHEVQGMTLNS